MPDERKKGDRLPQGAPRRMTDAKCAWRGMSEEQRDEFLLWAGVDRSGAEEWKRGGLTP